MTKIHTYDCKHYRETYWTQYGQKMYSGGCEFCDYAEGSCKGLCSKFEPREVKHFREPTMEGVT